MSDFKTALAAAKGKRAAEPITKTVQVMVGDQLTMLKFAELPATQWADIGAANPVRPGVVIDAQYGYNIHSACRVAAAVSGVRVEDDVDVPLAVERDKTGRVISSEWDDLFEVISGHEFGLIADAIWELNEWGPQLRLGEAKKASRPAPVEK